MYNKFALCMHLAVATCTSFMDIVFPCVTQSITMYICSTIPDLASKALIE